MRWTVCIEMWFKRKVFFCVSVHASLSSHAFLILIWLLNIGETELLSAAFTVCKCFGCFIDSNL